MGFNFSVNVFPFKGEGKSKAFASLIVDGVMEIKGFKVVEGSNGLFVAVPQREGTKKDTGERTWFSDIIFHEGEKGPDGYQKGPVWQEISDAILTKYAEVSRGGNGSGASSRGNAAKSNTKRPEPSGGRPKNPMGDGPVW
jgi:DNA-binding cell septation regulator SpoVG